MIHKTLRVLWEMVPELKDLSGRLRFGSYVGAKIDHPEGARGWFMGDGGIENLRFVWPVLWGSAHSASKELIRQLAESPLFDPSPSGRFDAREFQLSMGAELGEEKRLSALLRWQTLEEWKTIYRFDL